MRLQATVGAGLPVIATLKHLRETGDRVLKVEGIFSGTLSYIFNTFAAGARFSSVVSEAKAQVGSCKDSLAVWAGLLTCGPKIASVDAALILCTWMERKLSALQWL